MAPLRLPTGLICVAAALGPSRLRGPFIADKPSLGLRGARPYANLLVLRAQSSLLCDLMFLHDPHCFRKHRIGTGTRLTEDSGALCVLGRSALHWSTCSRKGHASPLPPLASTRPCRRELKRWSCRSLTKGHLGQPLVSMPHVRLWGHRVTGRGGASPVIMLKIAHFQRGVTAKS